MLERADTVKTDTDKLQHADEEFAARAGNELRNSVDKLDSATLSRLNRARQTALDTIDHPATGKIYGNRWQWLSVAAAAMVAVVTVSLWQGRVPEPGGDISLMADGIVVDEAIDIELLFADGDLAMYEELEFFIWLPEDELETIG